MIKYCGDKVGGYSLTGVDRHGNKVSKWFPWYDSALIYCNAFGVKYDN